MLSSSLMSTPCDRLLGQCVVLHPDIPIILPRHDVIPYLRGRQVIILPIPLGEVIDDSWSVGSGQARYG